MKKALTLALAVTMLISTLMFTSCDVNSLMEMLGGSFGSATTPAETTPEETTPPTPKRYTITEAEWEAALNSTNYTWKIFHGSYDKEYFIGDNVACVTTKQGDISNTSYIENKNGKTYQIMDPHKNGQWVAFEDEYTQWSELSLGKTTSLANSELFEILKYNEATKSYIAEESGDKVEFYFEDGKLIKGTITTGSDSNFGWTIENVGTTVVTLPQYKMEDELEEEENEETYIPQGTQPPYGTTSPAPEENIPTTDGSNQ